MFPEIEDEGFLNELLTGNIEIDKETVFKRVIKLFSKELKSSITLVFKVIGICIICSIIKQMQVNNENGVSEVAYYVCYLIIITLIISGFMIVVNLCKDTIVMLNSFNGVVTPILFIFLSLSGNITVSSLLEPSIMFMITLVSNLSQFVFIPIIIIATIFSLVSNISNTLDISRLGGVLKKVVLFTVEILLIVFVGILSLEGSLSSNVDSILAKTAKSIISTTIPVVGKLLGDATDSVIGATTISKNALGFIGILIIVSIAVIPIIKSLVLLLIFQISGAIAEPFTDKRIIKCFEIMSDSTKVLIAILAMVSMMFILQVSFLIKIRA